MRGNSNRFRRFYTASGEGVRLVIAARDGGEALSQAVEDLAAETGGEVRGRIVDTRDDASVDALISHAVTALGGLDIVVNAAARPGAAPDIPGIARVESGTTSINGLCKAEVIHRRGPWRSFDAIEYATLEWVDWFNNRRLLEPVGNIPPAKAEQRYYAMLDDAPMAA